MAWSLPRWQAALPQHTDFLTSLPNPINRADVIAACRHVDREANDAVHGFLASMIWGYGLVGYGPYRTAVVLNENEDSGERLVELARRVRRDGGPEAFGWLAGNRLYRLGVAFATKYLFFCAASGAPAPAPILDRLVRRWLAEKADCSLRLDWRIRDYELYVQTLQAWSADLGIPEADVEMIIFTLAASSDPTSQWGQPAGEWARAAVAEDGAGGNQPRADVAAVLEALDEAEEAFAALPASSVPEDAVDFARGLRQLRRIVVSCRWTDGPPAAP